MEADHPGDCALAFAIPLTRERFLASLAQPDKRDFVFHFRKGRGLERTDPEFCWQVYESEEVAFVSAVCEEVADRGVTIVHDVELTKLTELLAQFSVVTLVAHSRIVEFEIEDIERPLEILNLLRESPSNAIKPACVIEFSDGLHTIPELVESIPIEFSGLLDLTVCNSVIPAASIRQNRPNCLIAANRHPAELRSRMYLYGLEISLLEKEPQPFVDVITKVHSKRSFYDTKGGILWKILGWLSGTSRRRC